MLIDTHAHLTFPEFKTDLPQVIERARAARVEAIINIALDDAAASEALRLAEEYPGYLFCAAGTHPHEASRWNDQADKKLARLCQQKKIIAIGETGLDYHYKLSPEESQKVVFRRSLQLAQEFDLPAVIHSRDAAADTAAILREENRGKLKGVLHCFAGNMELGKTALEMGLLISFTANITFPKAHDLRKAVEQIPLDKILIETDCPFLAPQAVRGKRNEPSYVGEVAARIAEIKNLSLEEVAIATTRNARRLFNLV
jgi:TatD DNase family protein